MDVKKVLLALSGSQIFLGLGLAACLASPTNTQKFVIKKSNIAKKCIGVEGMTCVGCEVTLEDQVSKIKGVVSVKASSSDDDATIKYDSTQTDFLIITTAIKEAGYRTTSLKKNCKTGAKRAFYGKILRLPKQLPITLNNLSLGLIYYSFRKNPLIFLKITCILRLI